MKALTLTQPYATLIAIGEKRIETRSWKTSYRGKLALHAAKGFGKGGKFEFLCTCGKEPFESVLTRHTEAVIAKGIDTFQLAKILPFGAIVATCDLVAIKRIGFDELSFPDGENFYINKTIANIWYLNDQERAFGDYNPGRYAWLLANVKKLETPIPTKGALGLWDWNEEGLRQ